MHVCMSLIRTHHNCRMKAEVFWTALALAGGCPEQIEKKEEELPKEEKRLCEMTRKLKEEKWKWKNGSTKKEETQKKGLLQ